MGILAVLVKVKKLVDRWISERVEDLLYCGGRESFYLFMAYVIYIIIVFGFYSFVLYYSFKIFAYWVA